MRSSALLFLAVFALAGCDSILAIGDHELADDGGPLLDGGGKGSEAGSTRDAGPTRDAGSATEGGSESGVTAGCMPCVLGTSTVGSCCVN
jgi:hypothetical protein